MSTNFPGAADDGTTLPNPGANAPTNNPSLSGGQTNQNDAIKAIEAKVGTGASTPTAGKVFRGTGSGTSAWGALDVTTDLTGVLPIANGGTGLASLSIPASAILVGTTDAQDVTNKTLHDTFMGTVFDSQSATFRNVLLDGSVNYLAFQLLEIAAAFNLEVPATSSLEIIPFQNTQSFTSAQHNHQNAAGGGLLGSSALSLDFVESTLGSNFTSAASNTWQDTGWNITLPAIGIWIIFADIRHNVNAGSGNFVASRFFNTTTATAVANSERLGGQSQVASAGSRFTIPQTMPITTTTINNVIRVELQPGGAYTSAIESDNNGRSHIMAIRIG